MAILTVPPMDRAAVKMAQRPEPKLELCTELKSSSSCILYKMGDRLIAVHCSFVLI
ncbi:hypothetical protein [Iodobacter fluviatilis]|uniref:hypothetical protein n=1 Tax=Iodobacter fluviatilis TaxID=537 RepID=UPI00165EB747|nr:hypothetical protein [Iodobacter fluviatilis]